jgi:hypothetical protein
VLSARYVIFCFTVSRVKGAHKKVRHRKFVWTKKDSFFVNYARFIRGIYLEITLFARVCASIDLSKSAQIIITGL